MILLRPKLRLVHGPFEHLLHLGVVLRAEHRGILVKGVNPAKRQGDQQRQRQQEKPGRLEDHLNDRHTQEARKGQRRRGLAGDLALELARENRLPRLHPEEQAGHSQRPRRAIAISRRTAAHVRPEIKIAEHERQTPNVIKAHNAPGRKP